MPTSLDLSPAVRRGVTRLAADLTKIFGARLVGAVAYGQAASLVFVSSLTADDLDACGPLVEAWHRDGLATPLVMTPEEFRRSLDAFPLEYHGILARHELIAGVDPFEGLMIDRHDLRRACEIQARSHLLHLRQGCLEAAGRVNELARLIDRSAAPLRVVLMHVADLSGHASGSTDDLVSFAEVHVGMSGALVRMVLALETSDSGSRAAAAYWREYLAAAETLWSFVDRWQPR